MAFESFFEDFVSNIFDPTHSDGIDFEVSDDFIPEFVRLTFESLEDLLDAIAELELNDIEVVVVKLTTLASGVVVVHLYLKHRQKWQPTEH